MTQPFARTSRICLTSLALLALLPAASAQRGPEARGMVQPQPGEHIAWFGTLESGRAEAARTERPILLIAARPACRGVPGFW